MISDDFGPITDPLARRDQQPRSFAREPSPGPHQGQTLAKPEPEKPIQPQLDILTLKKQVIEEVRAELEREAREKEERDERAHQALLVQRQRE